MGKSVTVRNVNIMAKLNYWMKCYSLCELPLKNTATVKVNGVEVFIFSVKLTLLTHPPTQQWLKFSIETGTTSTTSALFSTC